MRLRYYIVLIAQGGLVGLLTSINWQNFAGTLVLIVTTLAGGFITIRQMIRADRKRYEVENESSLTFQIEQLKQQLANTEADRKVLRQQIESMRKRVDEVTKQMIHLSELLVKANENAATANENAVKANENAAKLSDQLRELQLGTAEASRKTLNAVDSAAGRVMAAVEQATIRSADSIPVVPQDTVGGIL